MLTQTFRSEKSWFTCALLYLVSIGLIITAFVPKGESAAATYIANGILLLIAGIFLWSLNDTKYVIKNSYLHWNTGPMNGKIKIEKITKIQYDDKFVKYQTYKPGLSHIGLVVRYNKFDDIFISPVSRELFIAELLKINEKIIVEKDYLTR